MNSRRLQKIADSLRKLNRAHIDILTYFRQVSVFHSNFVDELKGVSELGNAIELHKYQTNLNQIRAKALKSIRSKTPHQFISSMNRLLEDSRSAYEWNFISLILADPEEIFEEHTNAYSEKKLEDVVVFTNRCFEIQKQIDISMNIPETIQESVSSFAQKQHTEEKSTIDLYITDRDITLIGFANIIWLIIGLYNILCEIENVNSDEFPLEIIRLESGSKWLRLLGYSGVISILTLILTQSFSGFRDLINGTISREKFQNQAAETEAVIELYRKADDAGLDDGTKAMLRFFVRRSVLELMEGSSEVRLNDEILFEFPESEVLKIERPKKLLLEPSPNFLDLPQNRDPR